MIYDPYGRMPYGRVSYEDALILFWIHWKTAKGRPQPSDFPDVVFVLVGTRYLSVYSSLACRAGHESLALVCCSLTPDLGITGEASYVLRLYAYYGILS